MVVVCFDIRNPKRLYRVARELGNFGVRVQKSIFECHLEQGQLEELQRRLAKWIDGDLDKVRYYFLCSKDVQEIIVDGPGSVTLDPDFILL
ncbi:MAG: CRISPR-associated endonuclease Cas2 [Candidatus Electrothrix aestuarii]|uniref:CRISPR-associated endoribonuclease Cas2 n=1 Tax=Candidatus Electrothrix aestuarii TaxID=3062594 RepID=A0AAU8LS24_9BACT|nr:CRISPR-associated endonuclease Cas2 [Candidatus Electrothrix aestuarii]